MSSELIFRKGNAELLSYVRSSKMYEALYPYASFDKWSKVSDQALRCGLETLHEKEEYFTSQIDKYKEALKYLKEPADIYDDLNDIEELEGELKEINTALIELRLIKSIQDCLQYNEDGEKIDLPLEWRLE